MKPTLSDWTHRHVLDLAAFSLDDYTTVLELAQRFRVMPASGARKLPALQGRLVTTLFFEPSTRTRSSFELAAKRLSADVQSFSPSSSSLSKGESLLDTVRTYVAMGADLLVVRHRCTGVPGCPGPRPRCQRRSGGGAQWWRWSAQSSQPGAVGSVHPGAPLRSRSPHSQKRSAAAAS